MIPFSDKTKPHNTKGLVFSDLITDIVEKFGTPVFIAWESIFRNNCRNFLNEFIFKGRDSCAAYSYKTNNLKALCSIANIEGFGSEVVSSSELDMALSLGIDGKLIYYNGPLKSKGSIIKAISAGAALHVDSISELETIARTACSLNKVARIALRLTPPIGDNNGPVWSKFGFSIIEGELAQALKLISQTNCVCLDGLHIHMGTNLTDTQLYRVATEILIEGVKEVRKNINVDVKYIDIGGGFSAQSGAVPYIAHPDEWSPISISQVTFVVSKAIDILDPQKKIMIVCEPGRIIAESSMSLLARVVSVKKRNSRLQIIIDGGTNILPSAYYTKHSLSVSGKQEPSSSVVADFHGPLCTQFDIMASEILVPSSIRPGDPVLFHGAGAYTYTFSCQFVGPRPTVVLVTDSGNVKLIRQKEPENVLWQYDRLP